MEFTAGKGGANTLQEISETVLSLNPEKKWRIEIVQHRRNRSRAQNSLYWMWLTLIGGEIGYSKDEMHFVFAKMFLGVDTIEVMGETHEKPKETSKLKTDEFAQYLNQIEFFAVSELGIRLPHPDDLYWEALMKDHRVRG